MKQPTLNENEANTQRHPAIKDTPTGNGKVDSNGSVHSASEPTDAPEMDDTDEKPAKAVNRRKLLLILGAIALIGGSIAGLRWWQFQRTHVSTDNAQLQGHPSPIAPKIDATVQQVLVKDGDYVEAGQPLVILEDQDLALKVQQAEAQLAIAQAQLKSASDTIPLTSQTNVTQVQQSQAQLAASQSAASAAQAQASAAQAAIKTNQAKVAQAETAVTQAQADFRRYELLYQQGAIPAQQFEAARAAYDNAQAELAAANQTVAQSQAELRSAQADLQRAQAEVTAARGQVAERQVSGQNVVVQQDQQQLAQAQVKQAQAELALARQQIAYTTIKAPISGYVGELTAQVGQKVQANQPMLSLVPLTADQVYVEANFKETALGRLHPGESADVEVDAYPGETFHATIAGISPATGAQFALIPPDNATGNYNKVVQWVPVRLVFPPNSDPDHKLRPGLSVTVTVDTTSATRP
ncbi:MAG TPA: HlyD family secretion protein [Crinalium sp.]|jgi:membrane fusion protein (multidrug efflux system)